MSESSYAYFLLFGVEGHEAQISELFAEYGLKAYDAEEKPTESIIDGVKFISEEARIGIEDWVGFGLRELGISYQLQQDAKYEYAGFVEMFTPELGVFSGSSSDDSLVLVGEKSLDTAVDESGSIVALREAIDKLSGRAWRRHFAQLTTALKAEAA